MSMTPRQIALAAVFLALVYIAHFSGRFFSIGVAQLAPSIAVYVFMALLLAPELRWGPLVGIGVGCGLLTMIATSSPFPPANIPAHGLGFLVAAALAKALVGRGQGRVLGVGAMIAIAGVTLVVSWTLFVSITWLGLTNHPLQSRTFEGFGLVFGQGLLAWWMFGFLFVAVPTFVIAAILVPVLYRAVRPVLVRQGLIAGPLVADAR